MRDAFADPQTGLTADPRASYSRAGRLLLWLGLSFSLAACQQIADRLTQLASRTTLDEPTAIVQAPPRTVPETSAPAPVPAPAPAPTPAVQTPSPAPQVYVAPSQAPQPAQPLPPPSSRSQGPRLLQDCENCPRMVVLPAGQVAMGSPLDERGRDDDEWPQQGLAVSAFAIAQTEVTRAQWQVFERASGHRAASGCLSRSEDGYVKEAHLGWRYPGFTQSEAHPVVCISWMDAQAYAQWLSRKTGKTYRLPTEIEWEYAARAGSSSPYPWPEGAQGLCAQANAADAALLRLRPKLSAQGCDDGYPFTAPVGSFPPNAWGLYDMHGNVMEWVQACWTSAFQADVTRQAPLHCRSRVTRGGGWDLTDKYLRSAYRGKAPPANQGTATGFRLVRDLP